MPVDNLRKKKWIKAGYPNGMGSAIVADPPTKDFVRAYYMTSADYAISNIALGRVKVARFLDLNDPFELMAVNLREQRTRKIFRDFKDAYDSQSGLVCFSANWTNPVLWSHYGDKHRGICIGFNIKRSEAQNVRYEDGRILKKLPKDGDPSGLDEELQKLLLRTKYRHWQYEEEIRIFVRLDKAQREGRLYFLPFHEGLQISEVILGPQCNLNTKSVRQLVSLRYPQAMTFRARLAYSQFTVVPNRKTVL